MDGVYENYVTQSQKKSRTPQSRRQWIKSDWYWQERSGTAGWTNRVFCDRGDPLIRGLGNRTDWNHPFCLRFFLNSHPLLIRRIGDNAPIDAIVRKGGKIAPCRTTNFLFFRKPLNPPVEDSRKWQLGKGFFCKVIRLSHVRNTAHDNLPHFMIL